ncbi:MAG: quinone oxidoreductase [Bifidobacteriaceae bacterium]|jgi:NADPH2:quinone reductase|nr:quinone oxidoreductase [Bifidobacteriaceae bacterium]
MRAIHAVKPGPASRVLRLVDVPDPTPGPGQLLVRPAAIGVNFIDVYRRRGVYAMPFPHIPGSEGAGEVLEAGDGAEDLSGLHPGSQVAWASSATGSYAELVLVDAAQAIPLPDGLDVQTAGALALQGMTADYLVRAAFPVAEEHTVSFYAAAGGVGLLAGQMIRSTGARLIAVVGSAPKLELLLDDGVPREDVIVLGTMRDISSELPAGVRDRTDGRGVHAVFDSIGKDTFAASLASVRRRGVVVLFGASSGPVDPFDPQELNAAGSAFLTRPKLDDYTATRRELLQRAGRVFGAAARGHLAVRIGERFPLAEAAAAHDALESRTTTGKVLLTP